MRTFLQTINDFTAEYIEIPLKHFFLYLTIALCIMMIATALATPLSISKFIAIFGLYATSMITALLSFANYQLDAIEEVEISNETYIDTNDGEPLISKKDDIFMA